MNEIAELADRLRRERPDVWAREVADIRAALADPNWPDLGGPGLTFAGGYADAWALRNEEYQRGYAEGESDRKHADNKRRTRGQPLWGDGWGCGAAG